MGRESIAPQHYKSAIEYGRVVEINGLSDFDDQLFNRFICPLCFDR